MGSLINLNLFHNGTNNEKYPTGRIIPVHAYKMALRGIRVVELAGLAPGPFCGMVLSDFGAQVIRVDKTGPNMSVDTLSNGKKSIALNLKHREGVNVFRKLCKTSDVVIDTYRAGVMESLGIGPEILLEDNPKLIYARLSGYGQYGSSAKRAGHDINYVSLSGVLSMLHRSNEKPYAPVNIVADFGGGGMMCAFGIIMALLERTKSDKGQVVDCNMVEGAAYLSTWLYRSQSLPIWGNETGKNMLDGGAHFYDTYETKDGKYFAVGAIEPKFYAELLKGLNLDEHACPQFGDSEKLKEIFRRKFLEKTQKEWDDIFRDTDACATPVLSIDEAPVYPHNRERNSFVPSCDGERHVPGPAPKLSRTPAESYAHKPNLIVGKNTLEILKSLKYTENEISELENDKVIEVIRQSKI